MIKSTHIIAAFAAAMALASCSDDKQPWEQIPSSPITGNDAVVTFNGDRSYGVVSVSTHDENKATVTLSNIVPGYPTLEIITDLAEQSDGVFTLTGVKSLVTPPVMFPLSKSDHQQVISNLTLKGTVTTSGKADIALTSLLTSQSQGSLTGKWIPEKMLPLSEAMTEHSPVAINITLKGQPEKSAELSASASLLGGLAFYTTVGGVEFQDDGNVLIDYSSVIDLAKAIQESVDQQNGIYKAIHDFDRSTGKNLVFWYCRSPFLMLTPYIPGISYKIDIDNGRNPNLNDGAVTEKLQKLMEELADMGIDTDKLMSTFDKLNVSGVPVIAKTSGTTLSLTVTKEMIDPFVELIAPALPALDIKLKEYLAEPANSAVAEIVTDHVFPALGISSLTRLPELWTDGIENITLTINLTRS